ncbi:type IV pili methyl-accepting chemotaxis transducer N-terminal domain-containing protein [Undibacterium sp. SXout7W]|uniref:type IV pili methyl-accepting chemotaxis transducer N-terminal domain-containing protein n=1 Tax=Undibacterium sp. SXout7W TaxID=3413049 RepID=UPI003BF0A481
MSNPALLPVSKSITFRILMTTIIGLSMTLIAIGYTLLLSWQLEGGAAAINEAGSLRMRSFRLALTLEHAQQRQEIETELEQFNSTIADLNSGDAKRPLFLPANTDIMVQMQKVQKGWQEHMQKDAVTALHEQDAQRRIAAVTKFREALPPFVDDINRLVSMVEVELAGKTTWLRLCQTILIFMSLAASIAMLYLLYLWIIGPVNRMQAGIARMSEDDLSVRLPVETEDEFGVLALAFNKMADHVQSAQRTLEQRVMDKTQKLQAQNHEVSTLYEIAAFLAGQHPIEELCRGFLHRIMQRIQAEGGTVRILDVVNDNMHITVHEGISEQMIEEEHCIKKDDCLCGSAVTQGVVLVKDFRQLNQQKIYRCQDEGFFSIAVFQIVARQQVIGTFSLHFDKERSVTGEECRLLETLGQNLGIAIENQRLIAREKEFAVSQERNLLAQGLHDSIAQGLNFLNLQVQMLEDSMKRQQMQEIADIVPLLRAGVEESYEDVRELLLNFRTRLQDSNLESEMRNVLAKFERQSSVHGEIEIVGSGAPLAPEQQLQVLFILQEALSNIRKHAQAHSVRVRVDNTRDFSLTVTDDGNGFSMQEAEQKSEAHVGLRIMYERAQRLSAQLDIASTPGHGTTISLHLPREERLVA